MARGRKMIRPIIFTTCQRFDMVFLTFFSCQDEHIVPLEEIYRRLETNPVSVRIYHCEKSNGFFSAFVFCLCFLPLFSAFVFECGFLFGFCISGTDTCQGEGEARAGRPERPDTAQDHPGMGQVLQAAVWRVRHAPVGRRDSLLHRLHRHGHPGRGRSAGRQCNGNLEKTKKKHAVAR